jgi:hypothetical protein
MENFDKERIAALIIKELTGKITLLEKEELIAWANVSPEREAYLNDYRINARIRAERIAANKRNASVEPDSRRIRDQINKGIGKDLLQ